jgi:hypothetical protein
MLRSPTGYDGMSATDAVAQYLPHCVGEGRSARTAICEVRRQLAAAKDQPASMKAGAIQSDGGLQWLREPIDLLNQT